MTPTCTSPRPDLVIICRCWNDDGFGLHSGPGLRTSTKRGRAVEIRLPPRPSQDMVGSTPASATAVRHLILRVVVSYNFGCGIVKRATLISKRQNNSTIYYCTTIAPDWHPEIMVRCATGDSLLNRTAKVRGLEDKMMTTP